MYVKGEEKMKTHDGLLLRLGRSVLELLPDRVRVAAVKRVQDFRAVHDAGPRQTGEDGNKVLVDRRTAAGLARTVELGLTKDSLEVESDIVVGDDRVLSRFVSFGERDERGGEVHGSGSWAEGSRSRSRSSFDRILRIRSRGRGRMLSDLGRLVGGGRSVVYGLGGRGRRSVVTMSELLHLLSSLSLSLLARRL